MENEVRKVESSWPSSKICSDNSEWMVENVKGLDQSVKKMLLLIEHDGEIPKEMPHSNDPMPPELIACIKEISHRHHLLVEHYNKLTGDLWKYEKTSFGHPFVTPEKKLGMQNVEGQNVPSGLSLSSGGGISDVTPNEGSESSLLSSDSDSESYDSSPGKKVKHDIVNVETEISGEYEMLMRRILDYEKEVQVSKEKLKSAEDEIARQKREIENKESIIVKISGVEAQIKMHEAEMEEQNKRSVVLQGKILDLEAKFESEKTRVQKLEKELLDRDVEIEKLNAEIQETSENFTLEKQQFESSVSMLSQRLNFHEAEKVEMLKNQEAQIASWKLNYNMVIAEKDEFSGQLETLRGDLSVRDDQIQSTERNVKNLLSENDEANKVIAELKSRINELEKDLGMQKVKIWEIGEEKREAIKQLCFSLDHFKSAYQQLCGVYVISKRRRGIIF